MSTPAKKPRISRVKFPSTWFVEEIRAMMHGLGDCANPLPESAELIQEILQQQMKSLVIQLSEIATIRESRRIDLEDIVFLFRKDKVKLCRLLRYWRIKDLKYKYSLKRQFENDEDVLKSFDEINSSTTPVKKRLQICYNFVKTIDQTGELLALFDQEIFDQVKYDRDIRADQVTRSMDADQYFKYSEARKITFSNKNICDNFRDWILTDNDIKLTSAALEMLYYFAFETVAQLVDLAFLVKQDIDPKSQEDHEDPTLESDVKKQKFDEIGENSNLSIYRAITPDEIREVVRRYWQPIGSIVSLSSNNTLPIGRRLFCC